MMEPGSELRFLFRHSLAYSCEKNTLFTSV
jgi:hypothetical protein